MKAQILKIAGVKSEKEFYKKYKTEADFMKVHGKAFKKAQMGTMISGGGQTSNPKMINFQTMYDDADMDVTGMTDEMRQKQAAALQAAQAPASSGKSSGNPLDSIMGMLGGGEGMEGIGEMASSLGGARYGADIPRAQVGANMPSWYQNNQTGFQSNYQQTYAGPNQQPVPVGSNLQPAGLQPLGQNLSQLNPMPTSQQVQGGIAPANESGFMDTIAKQAGPVGELYQGYQALRGERRARKAAEQQKAVSDVTLAASKTRPEEIKRKYVRPEDIQNTGEEFFPIYGVGTNPLARNGIRLQDGGGIGGNPTEIQNTYSNGYDIYTDGGYEPLNDSNVKQYYHGGRIYQMQDGGGMSADQYGQIGHMATQLGQSATGGPNAGGQIGGTAGKAIGNAILPGIGGAVGEFVGSTAGQLLDTNAKRMKKTQAATQRNIQTMALNSGFQGVQSQNQSYVRNGGDIPNYEDGGYMNPEYNPQVITMFGDHNAQDFADYAHKDQYRAGGHLKSYTPPSERAMEIYEDGGGVKSYGLGGELQTHWGGGAETISQNPYLPGTGETVMFRGKSHEEYSPNGETGIGVTYGGNPVEVERGEPMVELEEGGTVDPETGEVQKSGVVFGNLKIPNQYIDLLGDKNAKGKKFKNYVGVDLFKQEKKGNKLVEQGTAIVNKKDATPLEIKTGEAIIFGGNSILKTAADRKINAAALQNAINDTAEEQGIVADDLARGKVKIDKEAQPQYAKFGGSFTKAQDGAYKVLGKKPGAIDYNPIGETSGGDLWKNETTYENVWKPKVYSAFSDPKRSEELIKRIEGYSGQDAEDVKAALAKGKTTEDKKAIAIKLATDKQVGPFHELMNQAIDYKIPTTTPTTTKTASSDTLPSELPADERTNWMDILNAAIPYLRPSDQESLDMAQLYPEMYAMSSNQLEPVPAQGYQPDLGVPYDISLQDQLNANQADYRSMQRMVGYNPAAQANLNAQKYQANQGILGDQFRANQAMKDKVYGENRQILNQAKLTNLGIYDKQYDRQAQALSNTKATTQAALNSIADKYAKNKLENRTLGVMENMYNYRFDEDGRAVNMNPLAQLNWQGRGTSSKSSGKGLAEGKGFTYDENGNIVGVRSIGKEDTGKNGKKISAKNGSIVKSYKNI
jgi:hypothetical protein